MSIPVGRKLSRRQRLALLALLVCADALSGIVIGAYLNGHAAIAAGLQ